jgi:magnesium transporter
VQRDLVESLEASKVAELIDEMSTAQAADVLSVLSKDDASDIMPLLDPDNAGKIQAIMDEQEASILNYATEEYLAFPPDCTTGQALAEYRQAARGKDVVTYLYIVDADRLLRGVLDIKEMLQAEDDAKLKDVMVESVISLDSESTLREASDMFTRYGFRALPITDKADHMLGAITYRDVVELKHRFVE